MEASHQGDDDVDDDDDANDESDVDDGVEDDDLGRVLTVRWTLVIKPTRRDSTQSRDAPAMSPSLTCKLG